MTGRGAALPLPRAPGTAAAVVAALAAGLAAPASAALPVEAPMAAAAIRQASPDSSDLLQRAREAQRRFERVRLRNLPVTVGWGGGECDDRVGRMCWRHGTGGTWTPDPDPPETVEAREELLRTLAEVAGAIPGDRWVLGQRVWYQGDAGRWGEALALARGCGLVEVWWCRALEGLALHAVGRWEEAGGAFELALSLMDAERAMTWTDPEDLLDGDGVDALEEARERGAEEAFLRRLWSAADPLWSIPGNDRLTEHFARRTVAELRSGAWTPYQISWGADLEELLVRYGWEVGWERISSPPTSIVDRQGAVGHEDPDSRSFVPPGRVVEDPAAAPPDAWVPGLRYAPSAYAPAYAPVFLPAVSHLSVVPLGDTVALVATWRLPEDTTHRTERGLRADREPGAEVEGDDAVRAALVLRTPDGEPVAETRGTGEAGGLLLVAPTGRYVASVEIHHPAAGLAGRHRAGIELFRAPPDVATLSDLLVLDDGPEPESLEDALPRLLTGPAVPADGTIRVAWVVAGLGFREETLSYRLSLRQADRGFLRRAGEWLGLVGRDRPQRLEWSEPGPASLRPELRSVRMRLPDLDAGAYVLRLELSTPGRSSVVRERRIEIPGGPSGR